MARGPLVLMLFLFVGESGILTKGHKMYSINLVSIGLPVQAHFIEILSLSDYKSGCALNHHSLCTKTTSSRRTD